MTRTLALLALCALSSVACERPQFSSSGESCTLNTDCVEPHVCGLERCRRQCDTSRDCAAGLRCLRLATGLGVCQLPEESRCSLASDCPAGLTCRVGTCTTECAEDRDCPTGAECRVDESDGSRACVENSAELCIYNSDCPEGLVCYPDQRCREECRSDSDCDPLRYCSPTNRCLPRTDAGL